MLLSGARHNFDVVGEDTGHAKKLEVVTFCLCLVLNNTNDVIGTGVHNKFKLFLNNVEIARWSVDMISFSS